jgi:hypothetical protein
MTGPNIVHEGSLGKSSSSALRQQLDQLDQVAQRVQAQPTWQVAEPLVRFRHRAIGPLHGHGKASARGIAQDQRVNPSDTPLLENLKALTPERVERVSNLYPSRYDVG